MFRKRYSYDPLLASRAASQSFEHVQDKAQQQFAKDADINELVRRFGLTGQMPPPPSRLPQYGDFTQVTDFHEAMQRIRDAQEAFAELPAELREEFRNDPARFVAFTSNPENLEKAAELGLLKPEAVARLRQERDAAAKPASMPPAPENAAPAQS